MDGCLFFDVEFTGLPCLIQILEFMLLNKVGLLREVAAVNHTKH